MNVRSATGRKVVLPTDFWHSAETLQCLSERNIGHVFRLIQRETGATQTHIGVAANLSQAQVSEIMASKRRVTSIDVLVRLVEGFAIPDPARTVLLMGSLDYTAATAAARGNEAKVAAGLPPATDRYAGVSAIYATRSEFMSDNPPHVLFAGASHIRAAGLSLNLLCQQYAERHLLDQLRAGLHLQCLFLAPNGEAIQARDREEGYTTNVLSALTQLNIDVLRTHVRDRLPEEQRGCIELCTYDETIRFNLIFIDDRRCIAQPYLPGIRGVESPTLIIEADPAGVGLYSTFERIFTDLWERSQPI